MSEIHDSHLCFVTTRTLFGISTMHVLDVIFAPPSSIDQTCASNADVTVHEAQMYNVLTIFSSHMIKHVPSLFVREKSCIETFVYGISGKLVLVTGQAILSSFVIFRARSIFFSSPHTPMKALMCARQQNSDLTSWNCTAIKHSEVPGLCDWCSSKQCCSRFGGADQVCAQITATHRVTLQPPP